MPDDRFLALACPGAAGRVAVRFEMWSYTMRSGSCLGGADMGLGKMDSYIRSASAAASAVPHISISNCPNTSRRLHEPQLRGALAGVQKGLAPRIFEYLFQRVAEEEHDAHRVSLKCQCVLFVGPEHRCLSVGVVISGSPVRGQRAQSQLEW